MSFNYHRTGTNFYTSFIYVDASGGVTGKLPGDFTLELSNEGAGNQATTGITIAEVDATNNAGEYSVVVDGTTGFVSSVGTYTLVIYDTSDPDQRWSLTVVSTTTAPSAPSLNEAVFQATASDGRVTDGVSPLTGASVFLKNPSGTVTYQVVTDANGLWEASLPTDGTWTAIAQLGGYQQNQATISVASGVATGPGTDIAITAIGAGALTAGALWEYARRQSRDVVDSTRANTVIKEIVNDALMMVANSRQWPWLQATGEINTNAAYRDGSIAVTTGSPIVTLTGGVFPSWVGEGEIYIDGVFRTILSRDSDTQLTLDTPFPEETDTGKGYLVYRDLYDLPDNLLRFGEALSQYWLHTAKQTSYLDIQRMKANYVFTQQPVQMWGVHAGNLVVWPPPSNNRTISFVYYKKPASLVSSADAVDWDPTKLTLLHRAIDYQICMKWGTNTAGMSAQAAMDAYRSELDRDVPADMHTMAAQRPMSRGGVRTPMTNKLGIL